MESFKSNNVVYTDGACSKNGTSNATGGFGIYVKQSIIGDELMINCKGSRMMYSSGETFEVTNIRMEGLAIAATMLLFIEKFTANETMDVTNLCNILSHKLKLSMESEDDDISYQPLHQEATFEIVTDSLFWMNVIQDWMPSWIKKGILHTKKNVDILLLLKKYTNIMKRCGVKMILTHVKSHQKGERSFHADGNDVADVLATSAVNNPCCSFTIQ